MKKDKLPKRPEFAEVLDVHFHGIFPEREECIFYEGDKDVLPLEIHVLEAKNPRDVHVIYTVGMSSHKMNLPAEMSAEKGFQRCELMTVLPYEWDLVVPKNKVLDNKLWWPVRLLEHLSSFPMREKVFLGWGDIILNSENFAPYAENTKLSGVMMASLQEEYSQIRIDEEPILKVYTLLPLYQEEMEFAQKESAIKLMERLMGLMGSGMILFPDRPNVVEK